MTGHHRRDPALRSIATQNELLIDQGSYRHPDSGTVSIAAAVGQAVRETRCYAPGDLPWLLADLPAGDATPLARTEVTAEKSLQAARRLFGDAASQTVGVLNFASARKPGGGYRSGAVAQEEDLCRCSALYRCLLGASDFYAAHRGSADPFYSNRVACSPAVPVFRDDSLRLLPAPVPVTFLSCPAPNAGLIARDTPARLPEVPGVLTARAAMILAVAARHGVRQLVLGAWGCGVFRNDPADVAAAFTAHLAPGGRFARLFERVVFAVYDKTPGQVNRTAFLAAFR